MANNDYVDRSMASYEGMLAYDMGIEFLKQQTRFAIEEATAKNLLSQAKLRRILNTLKSEDPKHEVILKAFNELNSNWQELNTLYEEVTRRPTLPWDEEY